MSRFDKYFPLIGLIFVFLVTGMIIQWLQAPRQPNRVVKIVAPTSSQPAANGEGIDYGKITDSKAGTAVAVYQEFQRADRRLNLVYRRLRLDYQQKQFPLVKLRDAERAWLKFRDTQLNVMYPQYREGYPVNSDYAIAYYLEKAHLTWERVKQLDEWLQNSKENGAPVLVGSEKPGPVIMEGS